MAIEIINEEKTVGFFATDIPKRIIYHASYLLLIKYTITTHSKTELRSYLEKLYQDENIETFKYCLEV